jgi:Arm DNA-binding domain
MLNDDVIRLARTSTKQQKLFDGKGLYLLMTPSGGRLWRFKYRFPPRMSGNKEKSISLGSYPEVSVAQVRERRDSARRDVANGIDPSLRRTRQKICLANTFEAVAREFISVLRAGNINPAGPAPAVAHLIHQPSTAARSRRWRILGPISENTVGTMERRLEWACSVSQVWAAAVSNESG